MDLYSIRSMGLDSIIIISLLCRVYQIQELAMECIEEWQSTIYYNILSQMTFDEEYLNDYKEEILEELREKCKKKL